MTGQSIIAGGLGIVRRRSGTIAVWLAIYLVVALAIFRTAMPLFAALLRTQREAMARATVGAPPLSDTAIGSLLILELGGGLLGIVAFAAIVRATLASGPDRFAFLRVGMDEVRLIGLGLLALVAALGCEIVAILLAALIGVALHFMVGDAVMAGVLVLLALVAFGALIYVEVRLSLAPVLTVIERRIVIRGAWRATRGRFWRLFGIYVLLGLVYVLVGTVLVALTNPGLLGAYASMDPTAVNAAAAAQIARQSAGLSPALLVQMVVGSAMFVVTGVVLVAAMTTAALGFGAPLNESRATSA